MKQLRIVKDEEMLDGFCMINPKGSIIYVNVEKLWKEAKKIAPKHPENKFVRDFTNTYAHELLHAEIKKIEHEYDYGEEKVVCSMLGDKWTKYLDKYYKAKALNT